MLDRLSSRRLHYIILLVDKFIAPFMSTSYKPAQCFAQDNECSSFIVITVVCSLCQFVKSTFQWLALAIATLAGRFCIHTGLLLCSCLTVRCLSSTRRWMTICHSNTSTTNINQIDRQFSCKLQQRITSLINSTLKHPWPLHHSTCLINLKYIIGDTVIIRLSNRFQLFASTSACTCTSTCVVVLLLGKPTIDCICVCVRICHILFNTHTKRQLCWMTFD